jgi:hypothetical protein
MSQRRSLLNEANALGRSMSSDRDLLHGILRERR